MSLQVSRILHAGYLFATPQSRIAFDPIFENPFSRNCFAFPSVEFDQSEISKLKWDAVFISHYHDDHCSLESLNLLRRDTPIYIYCIHPELLDWIRELGFTQVQALVWNQCVKIGDFEVRLWRALDADVDSIFQIQVNGFNILNVVDSWIDDEVFAALQQQRPWDLVLWPFQTMREIEILNPQFQKFEKPEIPPEWREQLRILNPRVLIPSSCQFRFEDGSWLNQAFFPISYARFSQEISAVLPRAQIQKLNPGESFLLQKEGIVPAARLAWVRPLGPQDVDYDFNSNAPAPSTAEIAQTFPALSPDELKRIWRFCQNEIALRWSDFDPGEFFQSEKNWNLQIYNHLGHAQIFSYRFVASKMELRANACKTPDWITEIPEPRLYGALENGESLTSLYVRIQAPDDEDLLQDPLLCALFNGQFGAYQRAQLRRIRKGR